MKRSLAIALVSLASTASAGSVVGSKHDLSASGPGEYRAAAETDACIFCHIAHRSGATSLWNRPDTTAEHRPYESTTVSSRPGAPTGSSRLCLSCHDGTIALGHTRNGAIRMRGGDKLPAGRRSNLGTDLRRSHPVSMRAPPAGKVRAPPKGDAVRLDRAGLVQCTSCHDPHDEWRDPEVGKFLVKPAARSAICVSCHTAGSGLTAATHLSSPAASKDASASKMRPGAAPTAGLGCDSCHVSHAADTRGRLLREDLQEDDLCLSCHGGTAEKLVSTDVGKAFAHTTTNRGRHDAAEGPDAPDARRIPETSASASRHVTCVDCHDPHASTPRRALAPDAPGALAGVWGIDLNGQRVAARYEYEVCFKCHADSANKPQARPGLNRVRRADDDLNLRRVFARDAASSHPVAASGRNPNVPSVRAPYTATSILYCSDCHASDSGPGAGGQGARGPHGSVYPSLLERQYLTDDLTVESPAAYALCYKCHDREVLMSDRSTFTAAAGAAPVPLHRVHVVERSAPCSACHDAHGVSRDAGNERNNAHLVSFDLAIVRPGELGAVRYDALAPGRGSCTLTCHGVSHGPKSAAFSY